MPVIAPDLEAQIQQKPDETHFIIVRVQGDLDSLEGQLRSGGFTIRRRLNLIRGFAASAAGADIGKLANESWVTSIEEDRQVQTM
jgi:hypothetical protein